MSPSTRETVLFWCQVSLYLSIMGAIITVVLLFAFWLNTLRFDMEEDRAREKAMLQQHQQSLQHGDQLLQESRQALQDHQRQMERLVR